MNITTWNINGIRASFKKGFWQNLPQSDIFCLQEIKADQLTMQGLYQKYQSEVFENNFEWSWFPLKKKATAV
jgi:exonuclease III